MPERILSKYAVIDLETTGFGADCEIIEMAAAVVRDGTVAGTFSCLVKPRDPIPAHITGLTGITNAMVADAEELSTTFPRFMTFIGDLPIVGQNVGFDLGFLRRACAALGIDRYPERAADTLYMSRERFPREDCHSLGDIARRLGIRQDTAHRALADVLTTAACYEALKAIPCAEESYHSYHRRKPDPTPEDNRLGHWVRRCTPDLTGISICVTGELAYFTRDGILQTIAHYNGTPSPSVTRSLTYLVAIPDYDPDSDEKSNKIKKAEQYIAKGRPIKIITEAQLMELLGYEAIVEEE